MGVCAEELDFNSNSHCSFLIFYYYFVFGVSTKIQDLFCCLTSHYLAAVVQMLPQFRSPTAEVMCSWGTGEQLSSGISGAVQSRS